MLYNSINSGQQNARTWFKVTRYFIVTFAKMTNAATGSHGMIGNKLFCNQFIEQIENQANYWKMKKLKKMKKMKKLKKMKKMSSDKSQLVRIVKEVKKE